MAGTIGLKAIFSADDKMSGPVGRMTASVRTFTSAASEGFGKLSQFSDNVLGKLTKAGLAATTAIGVGAGVVAKHVIESGADFEQSITNVGAVMGKSRSQIGALEKQALSLGVSTMFSANEVAGGMEIMARKGFDADEILAGIPGTLDAVAASGEGTDEVFTAVTSSLRSFGMQAKDSAHIADVLALATEKTGAGITNLGTSLAIAGPTARALGVSIEDVAAGAGLLQKMGLDASTAGSSIATMLAKISHPSHEAAQEMAALGVKFQDAKGNMLPFRDVLGQFVHAGDKVGGNMKRVAFFAELVGLRGDKAALGLSALAKSGEFDTLVDGLKNVDGYAHKVAGLRMDTTLGSWKLLTSTIEVLETKLFSLNGGGLKDVIDKTNAWVTANSDLIVDGAAGYVKELVDDAKKLADNIGTGVTMLGGFKDGVKEAFDNSAIKGFAEVVGKVFGGGGETDPRKRAHDFGETVGEIGLGLVGFTGLVKTAQLGVGAYGLAMKGVKAAKWVGEFASATKGVVETAQIAGEVGPAGIVSMGNAMNGLSGAAGEIGTGAVAAEEGIAGIGLAAGAAVVPILAIAAAIGSVIAAGYNAVQFANENGGMEGIEGFLGIGTSDYGFAGVDEVMNRQARQRAGAEGRVPPPTAQPWSADDAVGDLTGTSGRGGYAGAFGLPAPAAAPGPWAGGYGMPAPPPVPPPTAQPSAITPEALHAAVQQSLELTIKVPEGTQAEVTKKPKGTTVVLESSGTP